MASKSLALFLRLGNSSVGRWLFSRLVSRQAPYFATIAPRVEALQPGHCVVRLRDRRRVHNHIGTVHAIALCNAAELAGGLATDAAVDKTQRWIPKGMTVRYLHRASGTLTATAHVSIPPAGSIAQDAHALVEIRNSALEVVFDADITMWISPRSAA
jgi:acyl-coenzyme A thioesterase PaaI-like protein